MPIEKDYSLLSKDSKYGYGMVLETSRPATYSLETIKDRGVKAIEDEADHVQARREFEWKIATFNTVRNETIALRGHFQTPKELKDHEKAAKSLTINQLKDQVEVCDTEIEDTKKAADILKASVFSDEVKRGIENHGVASIRWTLEGYTRSEEVRAGEYDHLVALTHEKIKLLKEVGDFYSQVKALYAKELQVRESEASDTVKTLRKRASELVKQGVKLKQELAKLSSDYFPRHNAETGNKYRMTLDEFHAAQAEHMGIKTEKLPRVTTEPIPLPDFPVLGESELRLHRLFMSGRW